MRKLKPYLLLALIVILIVLLLPTFFKIPSITNIFKPKSVTIDETPILIKDIRSIGQLITYVAYDEVVADSIIPSNTSALIRAFNTVSPVNLPTTDKRLVLIQKGKVFAGLDLAKLRDEDVKVTNHTAYIRLPAPTILEVVSNPSDIEIFSEQGKWNEGEVAAVKMKAQRMLVQRAQQRGIIDRAGVKASSLIDKFVTDAGYKVLITR